MAKTWNYRVMVDGDGNYSIREVYYNDEKAIEGWTEECSPFGETYDELRNDMEYMFQSLSQDVIIEADLLTEKVEEMKNDLNMDEEGEDGPKHDEEEDV